MLARGVTDEPWGRMLPSLVGGLRPRRRPVSCACHELGAPYEPGWLVLVEIRIEEGVERLLVVEVHAGGDRLFEDLDLA